MKLLNFMTENTALFERRSNQINYCFLKMTLRFRLKVSESLGVKKEKNDRLSKWQIFISGTYALPKIDAAPGVAFPEPINRVTVTKVS